MNAFVFTAIFAAGQPVADPPAFHVTAIRDIAIDIQADLEQRGARWLAADGGFQQLLDDAIVIDPRLAVR